MRLQRTSSSLKIPLTFALIAAIFSPLFFPSLHISFFIPFIILSLYAKNFSTALWYSLACGFFLDLFSSSYNFGFHATTYTLCSWALYQNKRHFFEDHISTLPLFTSFYAITLSLIQLSYLTLLSKGLSANFSWFLTNLFFMPLFDGFYACVWFMIPLYLINKKAPTAGAFKLQRPR